MMVVLVMPTREDKGRFVDAPIPVGADQEEWPGGKGSALSFLHKRLEKDHDDFLLVCRCLFHVDDEIAIGASVVLGYLKCDRAMPYLLRALLTTHQKRGDAIIWAIGELRIKKAIPFLKAAVRANFSVKSAISALGKIGSPKVVDVLLDHLNDDDEVVRLLAARSLGQVGFEHEHSLIKKTHRMLEVRLAKEKSRRVRLALSLVKSKLGEEAH